VTSADGSVVKVCVLLRNKKGRLHPSSSYPLFGAAGPVAAPGTIKLQTTSDPTVRSLGAIESFRKLQFLLTSFRES
jgi:hypothetical protein